MIIFKQVLCLSLVHVVLQYVLSLVAFGIGSCMQTVVSLSNYDHMEIFYVVFTKKAVTVASRGQC